MKCTLNADRSVRITVSPEEFENLFHLVRSEAVFFGVDPQGNPEVIGVSEEFDEVSEAHLALTEEADRAMFPLKRFFEKRAKPLIVDRCDWYGHDRSRPLVDASKYPGLRFKR